MTFCYLIALSRQIIFRNANDNTSAEKSPGLTNNKTFYWANINLIINIVSFKRDAINLNAPSIFLYVIHANEC